MKITHLVASAAASVLLVACTQWPDLSDSADNNCVSDPLASGDGPDVVPVCPGRGVPPDHGVSYSVTTTYQIHPDAVPGEFACHWTAPHTDPTTGADTVQSQVCEASIYVPFYLQTHVRCVLTWIRHQGGDDWYQSFSISGCDLTP